MGRDDPLVVRGFTGPVGSDDQPEQRRVVDDLYLLRSIGALWESGRRIGYFCVGVYILDEALAAVGLHFHHLPGVV